LTPTFQPSGAIPFDAYSPLLYGIAIASFLSFACFGVDSYP
jgi:hypothetical protein